MAPVACANSAGASVLLLGGHGALNGTVRFPTRDRWDAMARRADNIAAIVVFTKFADDVCQCSAAKPVAPLLQRGDTVSTVEEEKPEKPDCFASNSETPGSDDGRELKRPRLELDLVEERRCETPPLPEPDD